MLAAKFAIQWEKQLYYNENQHENRSDLYIHKSNIMEYGQDLAISHFLGILGGTKKG